MGEDDRGRPRVLVGVDGSQDGLRAALYGCREALASGSDLWLVHAVDETILAGGPWGLVATTDQLRHLGEDCVREAAEAVAKEGLPTERVLTEVRFGRAVEALADLSAQASMVVIGRRSISGLERMFVGSTSVALAGVVACPLVVISAASTPQRTGGLGVVGVATDGRPPFSAALEWGVREAEVRSARLRVVQVVPPQVGREVAVLTAASADLEQRVGPLRRDHPTIQVDLEVVAGTPVDELVATSQQVDLLILGVNASGSLSGLARGVLAHAACPVGLTR